MRNQNFKGLEKRTKKNKIKFVIYIILFLSFILFITMNESTSIDDNISPIEQYKDFIAENKVHSVEKIESDLIVELNNEKSEELLEEVNPYFLREKIIQLLNIGFLLERLNNSKPEVYEREEKEYKDYIEKRIIIKDNQIGDLEVLALIPKETKKSSGKFPVIIGMHGHGMNADSFKKEFFAETLAKEGYIVIIPEYEGLDCYYECNASKELLLNGFSLIGLNLYRTALVLEYSKTLENADREKIGAIGHSAGSAILNLLLIINKDVSAAVTDFDSDYSIKLEDNNCCILGIFHETVPGLRKYSKVINNNSNVNIPHLVFDYGYNGAEDKKKILLFFNKNLKPYEIKDIKKNPPLVLKQRFLSLIKGIKNLLKIWHNCLIKKVK